MQSEEGSKEMTNRQRDIRGRVSSARRRFPPLLLATDKLVTCILWRLTPDALGLTLDGQQTRLWEGQLVDTARRHRPAHSRLLLTGRCSGA